MIENDIKSEEDFKKVETKNNNDITENINNLGIGEKQLKQVLVANGKNELVSKDVNKMMFHILEDSNSFMDLMDIIVEKQVEQETFRRDLEKSKNTDKINKDLRERSKILQFKRSIKSKSKKLKPPPKPLGKGETRTMMDIIIDRFRNEGKTKKFELIEKKIKR